MSIFGIGKEISEPITAVGKALDSILTSDEERLQGQAVLEKLRQQPDILQIELNKLEAQHRSIFVAGWRPAVGWVCVLGLFFAFFINPMFMWITGFEGPKLPITALMNLVIALLGLGGLRTYEKLKGVTK
jgi:hypothetical protein